MRTVHVYVKSYPKTAVRSYFPDKQFIHEILMSRSDGCALCRQDGLIFQENNPEGKWGIVTFDEALNDPTTVGKLGPYGVNIVKCIARDPFYRAQFVTGRFTSNYQLDVEFRVMSPDQVDGFIAQALSEVFQIEAKIVPL